MALQRNLKALGTFGYQAGARQNPVYIQHIPRTIRHVRQNLTKYERFASLRELLALTRQRAGKTAKVAIKELLPHHLPLICRFSARGLHHSDQKSEWQTVTFFSWL